MFFKTYIPFRKKKKIKKINYITGMYVLKNIHTL